MKPFFLLPLLAVWLGVPAILSAADAKATHSQADLDFFERKVRPVLVEQCGKCHNSTKRRGGLSLASRGDLIKGGDSGPGIVPGQPDKSLLIKAVGYTVEDMQMPPKGKLSDSVIADLTTWVRRGAAWPIATTAGESLIRPPGTPITARDRAFWSFRPITNPSLPLVKDSTWPRRPLDRFILAGLEKNNLQPVKFADRRALIRRVTFDLIGLPPTPEEVEAFVSDHSPQAWKKVIDRLLASPAYGERWGRHWLDVARYGEDQAHTFQARLYPNGWRYRDWVVKALNDDMPYDKFVMAQIAGDLMDEGRSPEQLAALGFFGLGPVYYADAGEKKAAAAAELDDRIDTLCRGFLGLTVACARCHDHKFDPISNQDYYSLAGIIRSSEYKLSFIATPEESARYQQGQVLIKGQEGRIKSFLDEQSVRVAKGMSGESARYMVAAWKLSTRRNKNAKINASVIAREEKLNRAILDQWSRYLFRKGSDKRPHLADWRKALSSLDGNKDLSKDAAAIASVSKAAQAFQADLQASLVERQALAKVGKPLAKDKSDLLREVFAPQGVFRLDPRQVESKLDVDARNTLSAMRSEVDRMKKSAPPAPPMVHALTEGKPADMRIYLRGNPHQEGAVAPRRFLSILTNSEPTPFNKGSGRLQLARAIAGPDNPLTARVMVNRIWQHHFGKGIVGTPSNFGTLGERPTHPDLLDHLASNFIASGWSIKAMHRDILLSSTYQLGCIYDARNASVDAGNRWYWRMDRRRLDVESWRDGLLAATGTLDRTVGGPPVDLNNSSIRKRTLYGSVSRHNLSGLLRLFDFPDANLTSEKRPVTIVPLQQLFVLNSDFMVERARTLSSNLAKDSKDDSARIRLAISRLYGRPAHDWEVALGLEFLTAPDEPASGSPKPGLSRWEQYAQVLLGANEFTFLD